MLGLKKFIIIFTCFICFNFPLSCFSADTTATKNINETIIENDIDFGPYMKELQRNIKANWYPPKGKESNRVVLLFTIAKDGRLLTSKIYISSGVAAIDTAALNAAKLTAPFKPLPEQFKENSIDVQFTFDYNVFGSKGFISNKLHDYNLSKVDYTKYQSTDKINSIDKLIKKYDINGYK